MQYKVITALKLIGTEHAPGGITDIADEKEVKRLLDLGVVESLEGSTPSPSGDGDADPVVDKTDTIVDDDDDSETVTLEQVTEELSQIDGIDAELAEALFDRDILDIATLAACEVKDLTPISGIGKKSAEKFIAAAQELVSSQDNE